MFPDLMKKILISPDIDINKEITWGELNGQWGYEKKA
jgi:hypothetical protein